MPTTSISAPMETFRWKSDGTLPPVTALTPRFRLSPSESPRLSEVKTPDEVPLPVIDLSISSDDTLAAEMAKASSEFGFFIVTNHGIPEDLWRSAAEAVKDVFLLPPEIKSEFPGNEAPIDAFRIFHYFRRDWPDKRKVDTWSEKLHHVWHPVEDFTGSFPEQLPPAYSEISIAYAKEMGVLMTRLLRLLSRGLGLEDVYLEKRLGDKPYYRVVGNYFPPCPEPDQTIGLHTHSDSLLLSIVRSLDEVPGLQILKGEDWVGVRQLPNSFVVNIGDQLEVLSNKRYRSVLHRVTVNTVERVSLAHFCGPDSNAMIGPIEELLDDEHPPMFRNYLFKEFIDLYENTLGTKRKMKEVFSINPPNDLKDRA